MTATEPPTVQEWVEDVIMPLAGDHGKRNNYQWGSLQDLWSIVQGVRRCWHIANVANIANNANIANVANIANNANIANIANVANIANNANIATKVL